MWHAERRVATVAALACVVASAACATVSVFGTPRAGSPSMHIIRVAEERGIKELSSGDTASGEPIRIEIPLEVRTEDESLSLTNGCALRPFIMPAIDGPDFSLDSVQPQDTVARALRILVPQDQQLIPAGERRMFTIQMLVDRSDPNTEALGLMIDESPAATRATPDCVPAAFTDTTGAVQHFGLQRVPVEPGGPGAAALAIIFLFALL